MTGEDSETADERAPKDSAENVGTTSVLQESCVLWTK